MKDSNIILVITINRRDKEVYQINEKSHNGDFKPPIN